VFSFFSSIIQGGWGGHGARILSFLVSDKEHSTKAKREKGNERKGTKERKKERDRDRDREIEEDFGRMGGPPMSLQAQRPRYLPRFPQFCRFFLFVLFLLKCLSLSPFTFLLLHTSFNMCFWRLSLPRHQVPVQWFCWLLIFRQGKVSSIFRKTIAAP